MLAGTPFTYPGETGLETYTLKNAAASVRPSRLVAEALVLRHGCAELKQRAQALGLHENLTQAMVSVCCKDDASTQDQAEPQLQH